MKKIAYRKIGVDCIKFFFLTLCIISVIIWVLQAVNYLDFVTEDGHGFLVYINYTLLSFPKIFSRIFPFAMFLAFLYILLRYENKNELVIFWNFGIKKIEFINFFVKISFIFVFLSLILNVFITPLAQDKARSFIRSSDLNFFESILKPKKFIDIVQDLTIYFDKKKDNGELENIFINDKSKIDESQTTFAKTGILKSNGDKKILVLYDGKTINSKNEKISEFKFSRTDFNITKYSTKTTTQKKIQENSTSELIRCVLSLHNLETNSKNKKINGITNCMIKSTENIYKELYSRLIKPFYLIFLVTISLLLILKSKSDSKFRLYKYKIYSFGFIFIVFLETSSKLISTNILQNLFVSILPILFVLIIYCYFLTNLKVNVK